MADLDLRPLSLGEIIDRTFSLYRRHFLLFAGITAIPQLLVLALRLAQSMFMTSPAVPKGVPVEQLQGASTGLMAFGIVGVIVGLIVYLVAYLFAQGGTVFAVSELYLGRMTTIGGSLGRMRGELANLFGVLLLNGILVFGAPLACVVAAITAATPSLVLLGFVLLIFPGFYFACRLMGCVPAALLENIGPRASLERSFALTKDNVFRAFVIYLLYIILWWAAHLLLAWPFAVGVASAQKDPVMLRTWLSLTQLGTFLAEVLVNPVLTIAAAVYYFDLRVRKEAFDLQFMMNPTGPISPGAPGVARTLS